MSRQIRDYHAVLRRLHELGADVHPNRGTGELCISHPLMPTRCRMNVRRGDAPLRLLSWLRHLEQCTERRKKGGR